MLSQRRDVGRCYLGTPSAIMEQSSRVRDILYSMLLKKKTIGCPKSRLTEIVNTIIFICLQILFETTGNTVVTLPLISINSVAVCYHFLLMTESN